MSVHKGPFAGLKVVEIATFVAGPMASQLLADQGAQVIKIEAPGPGDIMRYLGPQKAGVSALFFTVNRGKQSIVLDLTQAEELALAKRLISEADVLVHNMRPGVPEKYGLDEASLRPSCPRLIIGWVAGFGWSGPLAGQRVYDPVIQAHAGYAMAQADPETGAPRPIGQLIIDKVTALTLAQAISAALYHREKSGEGQEIRLSLLDAALGFGWADVLWDNAHTGEHKRALPLGAAYTPWPTQDGHIFVAMLSDSEFAGACTALALPDLAANPRFAQPAGRYQFWPEIKPMIFAQIAALSTAEALDRLRRHDVPCAAFNKASDVLSDAQVAAEGGIVEITDSAAGAVRQARPSARFSRTPQAIAGPAPKLGEHGEAVRARYPK